MKRKFLQLESKKRTILIFVSWGVVAFSFFMTLVANFFAYVFILGLVSSILLTKWNAQNKPNEFKTYATPLSCESAEEKEARLIREMYLQRQSNEAQEELAALPRYHIALSAEARKRATGYEEPVFSNITPKGKYNEFVVFDTETTGLSASKERIIELAAIRFVNGVPTEIFETFVNPEKHIPSEASAINHITDEMVKDAPTMSQILPSFEAFVGTSPLVAHNLAFDLKFIYYSGSNIMNTPRKYFDTLKNAQKLLRKPKSRYDKELGMWSADYDGEYDVYDHKLETLAVYYGIAFPCKHRAAADALVAGKLFLKLIEEKQSEI